MDLISPRLTQLSTQRATRGLVAFPVTSVPFWCLISGDIGVSIWLFYRANRLGVYQGSGSTVETCWQFKGHRPREHNRPYSIEAAKPRYYAGADILARSFLSPRKLLASGGVTGPPMQFWKPTEMELHLASRISMDEGPSLAILTSVKQAPLQSSEYDPVFKLSSPDLESKILLPESVTPVVTSS
jgi:hypothetical protein